MVLTLGLVLTSLFSVLLLLTVSMLFTRPEYGCLAGVGSVILGYVTGLILIVVGVGIELVGMLV